MAKQSVYSKIYYNLKRQKEDYYPHFIMGKLKQYEIKDWNKASLNKENKIKSSRPSASATRLFFFPKSHIWGVWWIM